jgi:hypothetical protein
MTRGISCMCRCVLLFATVSDRYAIPLCTRILTGQVDAACQLKAGTNATLDTSNRPRHIEDGNKCSGCSFGGVPPAYFASVD